MADDGSFQTGICSTNWWCTSRSPYTVSSSSPCATSLSAEMGNYSWSSSSELPAQVVLNLPRQESASVFDGRGSSESDSAVDGGSVLMDSPLSLIGLSSPTIDWSHALRSGGRGESNFQSMLQGEEDHTNQHRLWNQSCGFSSVEDSTMSMSQSFPFNHQRMISSNSGDCSVTTQSLPSSTYNTSTSYGYSSTLPQGLYEPNSLTTHQTYESNQPSTMSYSISPSYSRMNSNDLQQSWPHYKVPHFLKINTMKQQPSSNQFQLSNSSPSYWNPSAGGSVADGKMSLYSSPQDQFITHVFEDKPSCSSLASTTKRTADEIIDSSSSSMPTKKGSSSVSEGPFKKPRVETPSSLPTFKVRKEKLGDRITALQQLVSPFGKTDTASVLFEAIEYIKFLHEQVSVLSTPYMKNGGAPMQQQQQQINIDSSLKEIGGEGGKQDLRSRGLCLVPISSTNCVTNETTADFWTPTFGGTFR